MEGRGEGRRVGPLKFREWINAAWQLRERGTLPVKGKTRVKESCPFSRSTGILPAPTVHCITRFYYAVNCSDCCVSLAISAASRVRTRVRAFPLFSPLFLSSFPPSPSPPSPKPRLLRVKKTVPYRRHRHRDIIACTRGEASSFLSPIAMENRINLTRLGVEWPVS